MKRSPFGRLPDGSAVDRFALSNERVEVDLMSYGAAIISVRAPDRQGRVADVVLGFDTLDDYLTRSRFFGTIVGRVANRIARGRFTLDHVEYPLAVNNGVNHLHGGNRGFDKVVWRTEPFERDGAAGVTFSYTSVDGEEGYPGTLEASVTCTLTPGNELVLRYHATCDQPTPVNLTNHSYFNLAGRGRGDVMRHQIALDADRYTPVDDTMIPTGEMASVEGTPFDFRTPTAIGARIDGADEQLRRGHGYDHNFVLNGSPTARHPAASVIEPESGRALRVSTTEPGVQFYSGNNLDLARNGFAPRTGFCLETQHFPDSPNQPQFPSTILRPGQAYESTTVFIFGVTP